MTKKTKPKALVIFSGGQDSTTCLAVALKNYPNVVEAITFDYGQRHRIELQCAKKIAKLAKVPLKIIDLSNMTNLTQNALTNPKIKIKKNPQHLPNTFVPGRNLIFISYAAVYAYQKNIHEIYTGVCQADFSGYPDCRAGFIESLNKTLCLAMNYPFHIITPLMNLTKAESIKLMAGLGKLDWLKHTHTCYEGLCPACGKCPACRLRLKGFLEAGIIDPLTHNDARGQAHV